MEPNGLIRDDALPIGVMEPGGGVASPVVGATRVKRPDPRTQYIVGGKVRNNDDPMALPESIDDLTRMYGFTPYDALMAVPGVASSIRTLKLGIMSGDIQLTETYPVGYTRKTPTPEQLMSVQVKEFCDRLLTRVPGFRSALMQLLDSVLYGNKLGEKTGDVATWGPDKNRLVLKSFTVKPRKAWLFVVDESLNVSGILARGGTDRTKWVILPPEKFMWFTWMPQDNDPRGTSAARPAYVPANMSVQLYAQYFKYLKQFASPSVVGKTDPNAENVTDEETGQVLTPQMVMLEQLELFGNGSALVIPSGADVQAIFSQGEGMAFINGFHYLDNQQVVSILLQTRATREAEHGSKADSEQGSDILDLLVNYGRDNFGDTIRNQLLKPFVQANFGDESAELFTPWVYMGSVDPKDTVSRWNALANLYKSISPDRPINPISRSTQQEWHARADAPQPDQDEDRAEFDEEQERKADQQPQEPIPNAPDESQDAPGDVPESGDDEMSYGKPGPFLRTFLRGRKVSRGQR
jgi:hypothetical protein